MILTTDGKQFVFGVFCGDGCECDFLDAVFETEAAAVAHVEFLRAHVGDSMPGVYVYSPKPELIDMRVIELGKRLQP